MKRITCDSVPTPLNWSIENCHDLRRFNTKKEHKKCTDECEEKSNKLKEHDEKLEGITKERHEKEEKIREDIA